MATTFTSQNWLMIVGTSCAGIVTGSAGMYTWLGHRIEQRVELRVTTALQLSTLEQSLKSIKDAAWTSDAAINQRVTDLQERVARSEAKLDSIQKVPVAVP